ncbi:MULTISPECIES: helix-turn-helix domain-containing protein [Streptococcus]|uniref:winged helix-turn-helix transcriptional regulator n=1 Tax=Streptococcus TaxID=1301 RepID=UPI0009B96A9F|nr:MULTISPECIES: winged helix-turn-helix transcriptional regulator [Streptococcus]
MLFVILTCIYITMPLHTEYELTEKGKSLMSILKDLNQWGKVYKKTTKFIPNFVVLLS